MVNFAHQGKHWWRPRSDTDVQFVRYTCPVSHIPCSRFRFEILLAPFQIKILLCSIFQGFHATALDSVGCGWGRCKSVWRELARHRQRPL